MAEVTMRRVLVVDDSAMIRALYKQALARVADCALAFAPDGAQALAYIKREEPGLVFLDVNMPVMNGLELLEQLSREGVLGRVRVVMVTTEGKPEDVGRAMSLGAAGYITKPFRGEQLLAALARELPSQS
jgi:two-component system chemotaxis response regulator CheY